MESSLHAETSSSTSASDSAGPVSVQEKYAITVTGPDDGVAVAVRLAEATCAELRWAAAWLPAPVPSMTSRFGSRLVTGSVESTVMVLLPTPTLVEARAFVTDTGEAPVCVHWSPRLYQADHGRDAPWIPLVDDSGRRRDDARVYGFELAGNAVPLTTMGDRASDADLVFGPAPATGWSLQLVVIRDHLSSAQLRSWVGAVTSVSPESIRKVG